LIKDHKYIIKTRRLQLRNLTIEDALFIFNLVNEPSFLSNIGDKGVHDLEDARRFIKHGLWTNQEKEGYGQLLVELKIKQHPIGVCGLLYREYLDVSDVGFALLPEYRGLGYAHEAASAVLVYGHKTLGIDKIVGLTSITNHASIKVLKKLGMKFEKIVNMSTNDPGTALYSE
jgi:RimJ/RimL family protein N-acetyltransferase